MNWTWKHSYDRLLKDQRIENEQAAQRRQASRDAWNRIAGLVEHHFELAKAAINDTKWFDSAYVSPNPSGRSIQFFLGNHLVGQGQTESGAAAVVSQGESGDVIFLLYPYESGVQRMLKPSLIWHLTSDVMTVKEPLLARFVEDFLVYVRVSSVLFNESASDRRRVTRLERRSRVLEGQVSSFPGSSAKVLLGIASAAVAVLFGFWIKASFETNPPGWHEPVIGFIGLGTAWLTAWLQVWERDVHRAEARDRAQRERENADRNRASVKRA